MSHVDVLIVTALPEEYDAALTAPNGVAAGNWREHDGDGFTPYVTGVLATTAGDRLSVALARPTGMGGRRTGPLATTLADLLQPACLAMCGVCAGNPDDSAPGDVIVASAAYEWDEGKHSGATFRGSHEQYPLNDRWLRAAQDFDPAGLPSHGAATEQESIIWFLERLHKRQNPRTHPARARYFPKGTWSERLAGLETDGLIVWQQGKPGAGDGSREGLWELTGSGTAKIERILADDVDGPERLPFAVESGPIASGSAVIEDLGIWTRLKDMGVRRIRGLEMEAATIATVAHDREVPHWLVAKGVMDNANFDKDDRFKGFAARASAEVLFALLGQLLPARPAGPGGTAVPGGMPRKAPVGTIPSPVRLEVIRRLHFDWEDLADMVGVPGFERARFAAGNEPRALLEWLEVRERLGELPTALDEIGRNDLAALLRRHP